MYLKRIYSDPEGLFQSVAFKNGVNFIFGKKDQSSPTSSINSIGKSTFLDLIDFCLLSSYIKLHNPRLFSAKEIMSGYDIVLEFEIGDTEYIIKRNVDEPKIIKFGNSSDKLEEFDIDDLKIHLCNLIFFRPSYQGQFNTKWYRQLMNFFIKIQKFKGNLYADPIKYSKDISEAELNIYHFYLLGLNNRLSYENFSALKDLKKLEPAIKEIKNLLLEKYDLKDDKNTKDAINKLKIEIKNIESAISNFSLSAQYNDAENQANKITSDIKDLLVENFADKQKIEVYTESTKDEDKISTIKIRNIYDQLKEGFGIEVKKTLDDAINFRRSIYKYRLAFLENELAELRKRVKKREGEIEKLELERAKILRFLSAQDAIKDLTEAYNIVNDKRNQLYEIESRIVLLNDLKEEEAQIELKLKEISTEILKYINNSSDIFLDFYESFTKIYDSIFPKYKEQSTFNITYYPKREQKAVISITVPDMFGKGKNIGRTLVYDLFVTVHGINVSNNFPHFLIHDGIFDGVDKSHFLATYEFVQGLVKDNNLKLQYIVTVNEEGTLSKDKFGESDIINPEIIEQEAIMVLTPNNKLFGKDFENNL